MADATVLVSAPWEDHALIDSGDGRKLERYGPVRVIRPEPQALWPPAEPTAWADADAEFTAREEEADQGRWVTGGVLPETWPLRWRETHFLGRLTAFRHLGVFPEQASHWSWLLDQVGRAGRPLTVLNLFAYTGVISIALAQAGCQVTHVDASKKAIGWARENLELAGNAGTQVRWMVEDAAKFTAREVRRGHRYDIVLLDPPKFGRGPKNETWQIFDHLPPLLADCRALLDQNSVALVLTAYAIRGSFLMLDGLMRHHCQGLGGRIDSGELAMAPERGGPLLPTSLFSRWSRL